MSIPEKHWSEVWEKLVNGLRDHVRKNGFNDVVLGLSGGMDSSLVAAVAVAALGKEHVHGVLMPSRWTSGTSIDDALELADNLGIETYTISIDPIMQAYEAALAPVFVGRPVDVTEENLQPRIRCTLLMAFSNKFRWMLLATGNKSELAVGYCTLYGDLGGALAPIGDLYKTEVYKAAAWYNEQAGREIIPRSVFEKAPSAELRPNQTDQDSLPPYEELDPILHALLESVCDPKAMQLAGISSERIGEVRALVQRNAFKRRQAPPTIPVSGTVF